MRRKVVTSLTLFQTRSLSYSCSIFVHWQRIDGLPQTPEQRRKEKGNYLDDNYQLTPWLSGLLAGGKCLYRGELLCRGRKKRGAMIDPQGKEGSDNGFLLYVRYKKESIPFIQLLQPSCQKASEKQSVESAKATSTDVGEGKKSKAKNMKYFYHMITQRQSPWISATLKTIRIRTNYSSITYLRPHVNETGIKKKKAITY